MSRLIMGRAPVPVAAGPAAPESCAACGAGPTGPGAPAILREVHGEVDMALCFDFLACTRRYRQGISPAAYAAGLRGEVLAVAP